MLREPGPLTLTSLLGVGIMLAIVNRLLRSLIHGSIVSEKYLFVMKRPSPAILPCITWQLSPALENQGSYKVSGLIAYLQEIDQDKTVN